MPLMEVPCVAQHTVSDWHSECSFPCRAQVLPLEHSFKTRPEPACRVHRIHPSRHLIQVRRKSAVHKKHCEGRVSCSAFRARAPINSQGACSAQMSDQRRALLRRSTAIRATLGRCSGAALALLGVRRRSRPTWAPSLGHSWVPLERRTRVWCWDAGARGPPVRLAGATEVGIGALGRRLACGRPLCPACAGVELARAQGAGLDLSYGSWSACPPEVADQPRVLQKSFEAYHSGGRGKWRRFVARLVAMFSASLLGVRLAVPSPSSFVAHASPPHSPERKGHCRDRD